MREMFPSWTIHKCLKKVGPTTFRGNAKEVCDNSDNNASSLSINNCFVLWSWRAEILTTKTSKLYNLIHLYKSHHSTEEMLRGQINLYPDI